jgi:hypothetical protein
MDAKTKAEQDIISAADWWARGVLQGDRLLDLNEQNLLDTIIAWDKLMKRPGLDPSHLPPPPNIPHDMDIEDKIPTIRYSEHSTIPSPNKNLEDSEPAPDSQDIF